MKHTLKYWMACFALAVLFTLPLFAQAVASGDAPAVVAAKPNVWLLIIPVTITTTMVI